VDLLGAWLRAEGPSACALRGRCAPARAAGAEYGATGSARAVVPLRASESA
jgi:hypothetical protein